MKTAVVFIMVSFVFTTHSPIAYAQINLERSYSNSVSYSKISDNEEKLFLMDVAFSECRIYNLDHSLFKTIKISLDQGYFLYDINYVSRDIFNDDKGIELLYVANKYFQNVTPPYYQYSVGVVDELGAHLLKVDLGYYYEIKKVEGQNKLLVWLYDNSTWPYFKGTNIYSLKQGSTNNSEMKSTVSYNPAFPNPAGKYITIPLNLPENITKAFVQIFSTNGVLLKEYQVDHIFKELFPDISDFLPGIYHYNIISESQDHLHSGKFSVIR